MPSSQPPVGLFGISTSPESGKLERQFAVTRRTPEGRYLLLLYSFWDGAPNTYLMVDESWFVSHQVEFYPEAEAWREAVDVRTRRDYPLSA